MNSKPKITTYIYIIFLLGCLISLSQPIQAQQYEYVYLTNGEVVQGHIIKHKLGDYIRLQRKNGYEETFLEKDIERIENKSKSHKSKKGKTKPITFRTKGIFHYAIGGMYHKRSVWDYTTSVYSIYYNAGYAFSPHLQVGFTTGLETYENLSIVPALLTIRGDILKKRITPHWHVNVGYGFPLLDGGHLLQDLTVREQFKIGIGQKHNTHKNLEYIFTIDWRVQAIQYHYTYTARWTGQLIDINVTRPFHSFGFSAGIGF